MRSHRVLAAIWALLLAFAAGLALPALVPSAIAAEPSAPLTITGQHDEVPLGLHLEILEDPAGALTIDDVRAPPHAGRFTQSGTEAPHFGYTRSTYWARLRVVNDTGRDAEWLLRSAYPNMNRVTLYLPAPDGAGFVAKESGNAIPTAAWEVGHHRPAFRVPLPAGVPQALYLRFQNDASMTLNLSLLSPAAFEWQRGQETLGLGAFIGSLGGLALASLAIWLSTRSRIFLSYGLFLASIVLLQVAFWGLGHRYLWPAWLGWNHMAVPAMHALLQITSLFFAREFLETAARAPRWDRWLRALIAATAGAMLLIPFLSYQQIIRPLIVLAMFVQGAVAIVGVLVFRGGLRSARLFLIAWALYTLGDSAFFLSRLGLTPNHPLAEPVVAAGRLLTGVVLAMALGDQLELLRRQKAEALAEVRRLNADLEERVARRTSDLSSLNEALSAEIRERQRAEEALRAQEELFRLTFEKAPMGAALSGLDYRYMRVNEALSRITGYSREELLARTFTEITHPDDRPKEIELAQLVAEGAIEQTLREKRYIRKDGGVVWVRTHVRAVQDAEGKALCYLGLAEDITPHKRAEEERRRIEEKMKEAQRLESLGVLAGGIAHDFNNLLASVLANAEVLRLDMPPGSTPQQAVDAVITASRRAAELVKQMLAYAGKGQVAMRPLSLGDLTRELGELLRASIGRHARVRYELDASLPAVMGDAAQLRQVVMNLIVNASEAIDPELGGDILVSATVEELGPAELQRIAPGATRAPGPYVRLTVTDTGRGMDAETLGRIYDPFFTTKFLGRGLGLAAVHGIVRSHRGALAVESEPGRGTTFRVWLPATAAAPPPLEGPPPAALPDERGVALVIDDEEAVRATLQRALTRLGYEVRTAEGGREGLAAVRAGIPGLTVALVDVTMPDTPGDAVVRELRAQRPDLAVIMMSGYRAEDVADRYGDLRQVTFLQKPFSLSHLQAALRDALDEIQAESARSG